MGRHYRRMDKAHTPYRIIVDAQTLQHGTVTVREYDSMEQTRHKIGELVGLIGARVE